MSSRTDDQIAAVMTAIDHVTPEAPALDIRELRLPLRRRFPGPALAVAAAAVVIITIGIAVAIRLHAPTPPPVVTVPTTAVGPEGLQLHAPVDETNEVAVEGDVLWAATEGGVVRWDLETMTSEVFATELPFVSYHITAAPDGTVWASSWAARLARFDGARWSEPEGFAGLDAVNPLCSGDEPCSHPISAIAIGPDGVLYVAVGIDTLVTYDGRSWAATTVTPDGQGAGELPWAMDLAVAPDGTLWAAGSDDVLSYQAGTWRRFTTADGVPSGSVMSVAVAPDGEVWVATFDEYEGNPAGGVGRFDGTSWTVYDETDGLYDNAASAITVGPDGTVWVAHFSTEAGTAQKRASSHVSRFDGTTWTSTRIDGVGVGFGSSAAVDDSGTLWVGSNSGVIGFDGTEATALRVDTDAREVPYTVVEGGTDILATTTAKQTPPVATCPAGSRPDEAGPVDQQRPDLDSWSPAAFDRESGLVIAPTDTATWAFDVCTNTWAQISDTGVSGRDAVVYDADSDLVVAWGPADTVGVFDANTSTWTQGGPVPNALLGSVHQAVYDPVSGLIVVRQLTTSEMWAYDVDTDTWTQIDQGPFSPPRESGDTGVDHTFDQQTLIDAGLGRRFDQQALIYDSDADRILLYIGDNYSGPYVWEGYGIDMTWTFDPRAGRWSFEPIPTLEISAGYAGYWLHGAYDETARLSVIPSKGFVAGFDATAHEWSVLWEQDGVSNPPMAVDPHNRLGTWVVYDAVNERLLVGGGEARMLTDDPYWVPMDDIWAFDTETGSWIELVPPSTP